MLQQRVKEKAIAAAAAGHNDHAGIGGDIFQAGVAWHDITCGRLLGFPDSREGLTAPMRMLWYGVQVGGMFEPQWG